MVSSKGFTTGAKEKASAHGIILRDFAEITYEELRSWFKTKTFGQVMHASFVTNFKVVTADKQKHVPSREVKRMLILQHGDAKVFKPEGRNPISPNEVLGNIVNQGEKNFFDGLQENGKPRDQVVDVRFREEDKVFYQTEAGDKLLTGVRLFGRFLIRRIDATFIKATQYREGADRLSENISFQGEAGDLKTDVEVHVVDGGLLVRNTVYQNGKQIFPRKKSQ